MERMRVTHCSTGQTGWTRCLQWFHHHHTPRMAQHPAIPCSNPRYSLRTPHLDPPFLQHTPLRKKREISFVHQSNAGPITARNTTKGIIGLFIPLHTSASLSPCLISSTVYVPGLHSWHKPAPTPVIWKVSCGHIVQLPSASKSIL